jgi:hypothetical protein
MNVQLLSMVGLVVVVGGLSVVGCSSSSTDDSSPAQGGSSANAGTVGTGGGPHVGGGGGTMAAIGGHAAVAGEGGTADENAGASGASDENAGAGGTADGGAAGTVEAGGKGGASGECGGCAVLNVPLTANGDQGTVQAVLNSPNAAAKTVTVRACVVAGDANSAFVISVNAGGSASDVQSFEVLRKKLNEISRCSAGMQSLTFGIPSFYFSAVSVQVEDIRLVNQLSLQVIATGSGPWGTSIVDIDSITEPGDAIGPWTFASNVSAFKMQVGSVANATWSWVP